MGQWRRDLGVVMPGNRKRFQSRHIATLATGASIWGLDLAPRSGASIWRLDLAPRSGASIWRLDLAPRRVLVSAPTYPTTAIKLDGTSLTGPHSTGTSTGKRYCYWDDAVHLGTYHISWGSPPDPRSRFARGRVKHISSERTRLWVWTLRLFFPGGSPQTPGLAALGVVFLHTSLRAKRGRGSGGNPQEKRDARSRQLGACGRIGGRSGRAPGPRRRSPRR